MSTPSVPDRPQCTDAFPSEATTLFPADLLPAEATTGVGSVGVSVPGYEMLELLGRGGMGVVYKARQIQADRLVALKMILHAGNDERARFQTEVRAVARLQHPYIVQVYEVGEHNGLPFFSMEFCVGGLDRKLAGTPLEARPAAALVEKLARAIHVAHQAQVIHRDLKPANVLLTAEGEPKITDFGLAKRLDEQGRTQTGVVMGTPSYMAPEQASGGKNVGPAADVYALGAILYECLTGRPPFKAATPLDTILQVVRDEPVPPSQLQSKTPRDMETICLKCLHKEPGKRYATAAALADDLGRFQRREPIAARPVSRLEHGWRWCRRNSVVAALTGAVTIALLAGTAISTYFAFNATAEKKRADTIADKERASADRLSRISYADHIRLVQRAYEDGDLRVALRLLKEREPQSDEKDERGFEWHYLSRLCHEDKTTVILKDVGQVAAIAFSPDGQSLAAVREIRRYQPDGRSWQVEACELDIWDTVSGQKLRTLGRHSGKVSTVVFSPNGRQLVSGGWPPAESDSRGRPLSIKVWDVETGKALHAFSCSGHPMSLTFSPDGRRLASGVSNVLHVWDVATRKEVHTLRGHFDEIMSVAFSPDGKWLASASKAMNSDRVTLKVFDPDSGQELQTFTGHAEHVFHVVCSPDGRHLASTHIDGTVRLWDVTTGDKPRMLKGHTTTVTNAMVFNPDGSRLASLDSRGRVMLWDVAGGQQLLTLKGPADVVLNTCSLVFSPDGYRLAATSTGRPVVLWDARPR